MINKVAVYGTLRGGGGHEAEFLDTHRIKGSIYSVNGMYPAAALEDEGDFLVEVYEYPEDLMEELLKLLDRIEGVRFGLFLRMTIELPSGDEAFIYVAGSDLCQSIQAGELEKIDSGDWVEFKKNA